MKKGIILILAITLGISLSNCSGVKFIKFTEQENETYPSENLRSFLNKNKSPKVVLRTPRAKVEVTESEANNYLYDAIEKELLKQGFTVRDRQLFNQVISNNGNNTDYSRLTEKTDTDLIIELSKLDSKILYETNKYYTNKGKEGLLDYIYKRYGAIVEFKIILMKNNEFAGTYTYKYSPCNSKYPCQIDDSFAKKWKKIEKGKLGYEEIQKNALEEFITTATKQLVASMRN